MLAKEDNILIPGYDNKNKRKFKKRTTFQKVNEQAEKVL